jgi:hypothetical protein
MHMFAAMRSWYSAQVRCAARSLYRASIGACFVLTSMHARAENTPETAKAPSPNIANAKSSGVVPAARQEPTAVADTAPANPPPNSEAAAEAAYQQAQAKYAKQDVKGALESMRDSYRLCQRPELLYNLAMLERELHQCHPALDDYSSYLQHVPQGRYREAAEQAIVELNRECPAPASVSAAPPPVAPPLTTKAAPPIAADPSKNTLSQPDSRYWTPPRIIGWSAITAGVLAGGGALYFRAAAVSARSDYQRSIDAALQRTGAYDPSLQDKQHREQTLAAVLAVSGGALVTGGVLVLLFGSKDPARSEPTAQVWVQPGWFGASYRQRF